MMVKCDECGRGFDTKDGGARCIVCGGIFCPECEAADSFSESGNVCSECDPEPRQTCKGMTGPAPVVITGPGGDYTRRWPA